MTEQRRDETEAGAERIPWGQRFFDSPFVLLAVGFLVMVIFYTAWGLWEVLSLRPAPLP